MRRLWLYAGTAFVLSVQSLPSFAAPTAPAAPPSPSTLLIQAATASRKVNFEGVMVYRGSSSMEVLKVFHRFKGGHEAERVITLNGQPRELIRVDNRLTCILPRDRQLTFDRPAIKGFLTRLSPAVLRTLGQWYHFRDLGPTRIAGRSCDGVEVVPRDQYRFGYQVWVDTQTHVPLRVNLIGKADSVLEQVMFTEISFPANIPDSAFRPKIDTSKFRVLTRNLPDADNGPDEILTSSAPIGWTFGSLPPGFQETLHDVRTLPGAGGKVDHMLVSDGLSAVSVFIAPDSPKNRKGEFRGISRIGAVEAYGRVVDGHQVTVVGEVPEITVRLIGDAVKRVATGGATTEAKAGTH